MIVNGLVCNGTRFFISMARCFWCPHITQNLSAVADALEWYIKQRGVQYIHDDFLIMGPPGFSICHDILAILYEILVSPWGTISTSTTARPLPLSHIFGNYNWHLEKLRLLATVDEWLPKHTCTRRQLHVKSLTGTLHHACKVIHPVLILAKSPITTSVSMQRSISEPACSGGKHLPPIRMGSQHSLPLAHPTSPSHQMPQAHGAVAHGTNLNGSRYNG